MSKVDDNKKQKESTLLETAFHLFTGKGFAKTTISDIVQQAGLAKGTFYLYFKDKYDLRDKLIVYKANHRARTVLRQHADDARRQRGLADSALSCQRYYLCPALAHCKILPVCEGAGTPSGGPSRCTLSCENVFFLTFAFHLTKYHITPRFSRVTVQFYLSLCKFNARVCQ